MLVFDSLPRKDLSSKTEGSGVALPHYHSVHAVHGSVYPKALDNAAFFALMVPSLKMSLY